MMGSPPPQFPCYPVVMRRRGNPDHENYTREEKLAFARTIRANMPRAERLLWPLLRSRRLLGLRFRRQHLVMGWLADFYCSELQLVIELDGPLHDQKKDAFRDSRMNEEGYSVVRIPNHIVFSSPDRAASIIKVVCRRLMN